MIYRGLFIHCQGLVNSITGWWQLTYDLFWIFTPENWGNEFHFNKYFSKGLKPPTRLFIMVIFLSIQIWNHKPTHTHTHTPVLILLMVQKSGDHQLREWYFIPVFTKGLGYIQMVVGLVFFPSTVSVTPWKTQSHGGLESMIFQKNGVIFQGVHLPTRS